jgi:hypothetical protein
LVRGGRILFVDISVDMNEHTLAYRQEILDAQASLRLELFNLAKLFKFLLAI